MTTSEAGQGLTQQTFASSIQADVRSLGSVPYTSESWRFDAMSDDGSECVIVDFADGLLDRTPSGQHPSTRGATPTVEFAYYKSGKAIYRSFEQYAEKDIAADCLSAECTIGESSFKLESAPYGSGFTVRVDCPLGRNRRVEAHLEWLFIESNLRPGFPEAIGDVGLWNVAAPRCDVTGRITVFDRRGEIADVRHFRGTGYHDHVIDLLAPAGRSETRGRAHFADSTVFFSFGSDAGTLYIIRSGELYELPAAVEKRRRRAGIRSSERIDLTANEGVDLLIKPLRVLDSAPNCVRQFCEMKLSETDGKTRSEFGLMESHTPARPRYRWLELFKGKRSVS